MTSNSESNVSFMKSSAISIMPWESLMNLTCLKRSTNTNMESTFTTFTLPSVIQVSREKFTMCIFTLTMIEELSFCLDLELREFMDRIFWSTDRSTTILWTDCLKRLMTHQLWKLSLAQCLTEDKPFIESLTLNWFSDCLILYFLDDLKYFLFKINFTLIFL